MPISSRKKRPFKGTHLLKPLIKFISEKVDVDITSTRRDTKYVFGRMVYYHIALNYINVTLVEVSQAIGKHHSAVLNGYEKSAQALEEPLYDYIAACALQYVEDLHFRREIKDSATEYSAMGVMQDKIDYLERVISDLVDGRAFGALEAHEVAYRELSEDKKELFKSRVEPILKMI